MTPEIEPQDTYDSYSTMHKTFNLVSVLFPLLLLMCLPHMYSAWKVSHGWQMQLDIFLPWFMFASLGWSVWREAKSKRSKIEEVQATGTLMLLGLATQFLYEALGKFATHL